MNNLDDLIQCCQQKQKLKFLYFWGHQPKSNGLIGAEIFSQWYPAPFECNGVKYATAEHYMMAQKAILFDDTEQFQAIIQSSHPKQAKDLGRLVKEFNQQIWEQHREQIVFDGNLAKFSQHQDLKTFLLSTGDRVLVEASPVDKIWGIGLAKDAEHIDNPLTWKGLNLLGFALMKVRTVLQQGQV